MFYFYILTWLFDYYFMKAMLFGPESLTQSHKYAKPDKMGMKWGIKSSTIS